ncbi:MAG: FAD-dependent monooxygenase [Burkholderiaceae bacterium]
MSTAIEFETDVLVVGTGPTGAAAALALATYGARTHVVSRWNWLANTPRAHITNQRAIEVLRDLGLEAEARKHATPWEQMGETMWTTSLAGPEIARLRSWGTGEERIGDYLQASPCPMLDLPQTFMEPLLVQHAAARGASLAMNTEYLSLRQDADGVDVLLRDRLSGREYTVRTKYLVGADGARSKIVDDLKLPLEGHLARAGTHYTLFRADLARYAAHRPSILYWIVTPDSSFGEIGQGVLRAIRPWNQWIAGWGFDKEAGEPQYSDEELVRRIRILIGDETVPIEIESRMTWYVNQQHAPEYASGRVFCGGDAVHRHPPSSGLGSNTSIQDAFNLAWKLAFVLKGWAGPRLLDSYSLERAPVGRQVVWRANQSRLDYAPLNRAFRDMDSGDPVRDGLARLADPGADGVARRQALAAALALKNTEFNALGIEANQRCVSAAVLPDGPADPLDDEHPPSVAAQLHARPTTRPGAKIPHVWLVDAAGYKLSTLDVVGKGLFTLVTGLAGTAWPEAAARLVEPCLRTVVIGAPGLLDVYCSWSRVREVDEAGALLVRPDGVVAWRCMEPEQDPAMATQRLRRGAECAARSGLTRRGRDTIGAGSKTSMSSDQALVVIDLQKWFRLPGPEAAGEATGTGAGSAARTRAWPSAAAATTAATSCEWRAPDQRALVDRIDDAHEFDLEGFIGGLAAQIAHCDYRGGRGLQVGHVGLLGHPVRAGEAARVADHVDCRFAGYPAMGIGHAAGRPASGSDVLSNHVRCRSCRA